MRQRAYGQFCGLAYALDVVGERWSLLIVRDLLVGPRRYTDLRRGLSRIPTNVLSARLKELEAAGVAQRRALPRPQGSVVYELTDYGRDLEPAVLALGRWGARTLGEPDADDIVTPESLVMALRSTFRPNAAENVHVGYELHIGEVVLHARVDDGGLEADAGPLPEPDLIINSGPAIRALMAGELTPAAAIQADAIRIKGDPKHLEQFARMFRI